jgi:1,4-dihydroxy-2-naphthoyl-CoA hydrolase
MTIWTYKPSIADLNERSKNTLSDHLGIEYLEVKEDSLIAKMNIQSFHLQPMGIMHGGASCALAETIGSAAANYCVDQNKYVCVGLDININHIKAKKTGFILAEASPLHLGRKTQVWHIELTDEKNKRVAVSRLTIAVIEKSVL